jgi:hypothetical protein
MVQMLELAAARPTEEPIPNFLQMLESFAEIVRDAKKNPKVEPFVGRAVALFIANEPSTWKANFAQMDPFCAFLKYVEREDLALAWKRVYDLNKETIEQQFARRDGTLMTSVVDGSQKLEIDLFNSILHRAEDLYKLPFVLPEESTGDDAGPRAWKKLGREAEALLRGDLIGGRFPKTTTLDGVTVYDPEYAPAPGSMSAWQTARLEFLAGVLGSMKLCAANHMQFRYGRTNLAMTCHHSQVITVLLSALFHFQRRNFSRKTAIFEVGTGEGKSLIIAMIALYFWRVHGKRVHVLVNNSKLGKRDADEYADFYKLFRNKYGSSPSIGTDELHGGLHEQANEKRLGVVCSDEHERARLQEVEDRKIFHRFASHDISYLNARSVVWFYQYALMKEGGVHFSKIKDTILLVDEVDDIIVGDEGVSTWVMIDKDESMHMTHALNRVMGFPYIGEHVGPEYIQKAHELKARTAKALAERSACKNGFTLTTVEGVHEYVNNNGDPVNRFGDEKEFIGVKESKGEKPFRVQQVYVYSVPSSLFLPSHLHSLSLLLLSHFISLSLSLSSPQVYFYCALTEVFRTYECIFGFSGSLGGRREKTFLAEKYKAVIMYIPRFLSTCKNVPRNCGRVDMKFSQMVVGNDDKHVDSIISRARDYQKLVPVLVVARNREFATKIFNRLHETNEASQLFINDKGGIV